MSEESTTVRTGDPMVDAALGRVDDVGTLPLAEQVSVFEAVHSALQESLADPED